MRIGRYVLKGELSRGGMGVVYRAHDPERGRDVAVKLLLSPDAPTDAQRRRFQREVDAVLRLRHPHIVPALDCGEERGWPYLVLELIPGGSLAEALERNGPLPPREAAEVALHLAEALAHAHAQGVLHRDVKPANVMLDPEVGALLFDFGLTRDVDGGQSRLTRSGVATGSPGFMPPEQALGRLEQVGPASDVYALGATLYATLCGRPPVEGDSLPEVLAATLRQTPAPTGADPALDAICRRCLAKEPGDRYASAEQLAEALRDYLHPRASRLRGRRRRLALAASAVGLLVLAAAGWALGRAGQPGAPAPSPAEALRLRGVALRGEGRVVEALACFDQGIGLSPNLATLHYDRGFCNLLLGRPAEALSDFERTLQLSPDLPQALEGKGEAEKRLDRPEEALATFERLIRLDPKRAQPYVGRGAALFTLGRMEDAEEAYSRALELNPRLAQAWGGRGTVRDSLGRWAEASQDLTRALELTPGDTGWRLSRAFVLCRLGRWAEVQADVDRALAEGAEGYQARMLRGHARVQQGDCYGAAEDYERALAALDPQDPRVPEARRYLSAARVAAAGGR